MAGFGDLMAPAGRGDSADLGSPNPITALDLGGADAATSEPAPGDMPDPSAILDTLELNTILDWLKAKKILDPDFAPPEGTDVTSAELAAPPPDMAAAAGPAPGGFGGFDFGQLPA